MRTARHTEKKYATIESIYRFMRGEEAPRHPANVFLEVSNLCDLKCAMCGPFSALNPYRLHALKIEERGFMERPDPALLQEVLEHALRIQVFGYGEPTVHPEFTAFLDLAGEYETLICFFTNGMHLTPALIEKLIDHQVHEITISFSGSTKEHYESIYIGGSWEKVLGGLRELAERKRARASQYPVVSVNSLAYRHHVDRFDDFVRVMSDVGVNLIYLKQLVPTVPALAPHTAIYREWVEGQSLNRAETVAAERGVRLNLWQFTSFGAQDEADYESKHRRMFAMSGVDPDQSDEVVPIEELRGLAPSIRVERPPKALMTKSSAFEGESLSGRDLGAEGLICLEPFNTMYIGRNLEVKPCCNMPSYLAFDKLHERPAQAVWNGEAFGRARGELLNGRYPSFCHACVRNGNAYASHAFVDTVAQYGTWFGAVFGQPFLCRPLGDLQAMGGNQAIAARWSDRPLLARIVDRAQQIAKRRFARIVRRARQLGLVPH